MASEKEEAIIAKIPLSTSFINAQAGYVYVIHYILRKS